MLSKQEEQVIQLPENFGGFTFYQGMNGTVNDPVSRGKHIYIRCNLDRVLQQQVSGETKLRNYWNNRMMEIDDSLPTDMGHRR